MTIQAQASVTTSASVDEARALVEANLAAAGMTMDTSNDDEITGTGGKFLKYRLLGMWLSHADQLPISIDVEFTSTDHGTLVTAAVSDRQGFGIKLTIEPEKYQAAGQAAIAATFVGLTPASN